MMQLICSKGIKISRPLGLQEGNIFKFPQLFSERENCVENIHPSTTHTSDVDDDDGNILIIIHVSWWCGWPMAVMLCSLSQWCYSSYCYCCSCYRCCNINEQICKLTTHITLLGLFSLLVRQSNAINTKQQQQ